MTSQTHFTVIIPTRDRADTLRECLRTCVVQDYANVRFIVSNNASLDDTEAVVRSFEDPRVELISTGARLGMSQNFEFAIRHAFATGPENTFLGMMGDDDGLMRNGLATWDRYIRDHPGVRAFSWPFSCYNWPDCVEALAGNRLAVAVVRKGRLFDPQKELQRFGRFEASYVELARVYYGLVHRSVVESIERGGRLIHSMIPDVYLGAATSAALDRVAVCPYPLMLPAISRHSSGGEHVIGGATRAPSEVRAQFRTEPNLPPHPKIGVMPPAVPICELETMLQVADQGIYPFTPDAKGFFAAAIRDLADKGAAKREEVMDRLEKIAATMGWEEAWEVVREKADRQQQKGPETEARLIFASETVSGQIDGGPHGLRNIFDATGLFSLLLGNGDIGASVFGQAMDLAAQAPPGPPAPVQGIPRLEAKNLARQFAKAAKKTRKAVDALYRSKRWRVSRLLANPKSWRKRKTDTKLEAACLLLNQAATAAEEIDQHLKNP
jgi:hypothetical protein